MGLSSAVVTTHETWPKLFDSAWRAQPWFFVVFCGFADRISSVRLAAETARIAALKVGCTALRPKAERFRQKRVRPTSFERPSSFNLCFSFCFLEASSINSINVIVNGEKIELPEGSTVSELLKRLEIDSRALAVEVNQQIKPRNLHSVTVIADGDVLEIVTLVGGG